MSRSGTHEEWMSLALTLAGRAWGRTSPNPLVGAVLVKDGLEVGRGFHEKAGGAHAEAAALTTAGEAAAGADLYVTLEPCCSHGRTPPCTEAVIRAGVRRVYIGCLDPNPKHAGRGVRQLSEAGLEVQAGILEDKCRRLNEAFFCWITQKRPFVLLKLAMTLDGRIATATGGSFWITGEPARNYTQRLRQWADAIMVGAETLRVDRPRLTVREPEDWSPQPQPVIWSRSGSLPEEAVAGLAVAPLITAPHSASEWHDFLLDLGARNYISLLIEGGGELAASALRAGAVDKIAFFLAPKILGGRGSRPGVGGADPATLAEALQVCEMHTEMIGEDILVSGYLQ